MGIAASLFFNTAEPRECLDWRIRPSDEQYDSQKQRWNDLKDHLLADLQERSGYPTASWLQGSYKFGTQVRPARKDEEFDIDLGVYFRWAGAPEDGRYEPPDFKAFVQESLYVYLDSQDNDAQGVSKPKPRCNRIHYADNFHIDVPSYHLDGERDARMLATEECGWEDSDPKQIYRWWKDSILEQDRPRVRRLARYLKMWAALRFEDGERPSSILITVLAAEAFLQLNPDALSGDDEYLRAVAQLVAGRLRKSTFIANPANTRENLYRLNQSQTEKFLYELDTLIATAERALAVATKTQSADIWSEVFSYFFPIPAEDEVLAEMAKALTPIAFSPEIEVVATPPNGGPLFRGINTIGPIPKNSSIEFAIRNAYDLPFGATVTWTVRNAGSEAEQINDLGHPAGTGVTARETAAYAGTHFMDVAIRLNGALIGQRRVSVTIRGGVVVSRNARRPDWVRFRRKRA